MVSTRDLVIHAQEGLAVLLLSADCIIVFNSILCADLDVSFRSEP